MQDFLASPLDFVELSQTAVYVRFVRTRCADLAGSDHDDCAGAMDATRHCSGSGE